MRFNSRTQSQNASTLARSAAAESQDAAVIAAAGGHNLLMIGPPGEGKSLLASAIPGILPRLQNGEKVDLTKIYSACGELHHDGYAVTRRPFRSVHHTASKQSLVGGGSKIPRPVKSRSPVFGVLFLDEIAELRRLPPSRLCGNQSRRVKFASAALGQALHIPADSPWSPQ